MSANCSLVFAILVAVLIGASLASTEGHPHPVPRPHTTPAPTPAPPLPPKPSCQLTPKCQQGLTVHRPCLQTTRNGGHNCYKGLKVWQKDLTQNYGCPEFTNASHPVLDSQAFCWCGLGVSASDSLPAIDVSSEGQVSANGGFHGFCHTKLDGKKLKHRGKGGVSNDMKACEQQLADEKDPPSPGSKEEHGNLTNCMSRRVGGLHIRCAACFAFSIQCSVQNCAAECACVGYTDPHCSTCMKQHCKYRWDGLNVHMVGGFDYCSGLKTPSAAAAAPMSEDGLEDDLDFFGNEDTIVHGSEAIVV